MTYINNLHPGNNIVPTPFEDNYGVTNNVQTNQINNNISLVQETSPSSSFYNSTEGESRNSLIIHTIPSLNDKVNFVNLGNIYKDRIKSKKEDLDNLKKGLNTKFNIKLWDFPTSSELYDKDNLKTFLTSSDKKVRETFKGIIEVYLKAKEKGESLLFNEEQIKMISGHVCDNLNLSRIQPSSIKDSLSQLHLAIFKHLYEKTYNQRLELPYKELGISEDNLKELVSDYTPFWYFTKEEYLIFTKSSKEEVSSELVQKFIYYYYEQLVLIDSLNTYYNRKDYFNNYSNNNNSDDTTTLSQGIIESSIISDTRTMSKKSEIITEENQIRVEVSGSEKEETIKKSNSKKNELDSFRDNKLLKKQDQKKLLVKNSFNPKVRFNRKNFHSELAFSSKNKILYLTPERVSYLCVNLGLLTGADYCLDLKKDLERVCNDKAKIKKYLRYYYFGQFIFQLIKLVNESNNDSYYKNKKYLYSKKKKSLYNNSINKTNFFKEGLNLNFDKNVLELVWKYNLELYSFLFENKLTKYLNWFSCKKDQTDFSLKVYSKSRSTKKVWIPLDIVQYITNLPSFLRLAIGIYSGSPITVRQIDHEIISSINKKFGNDYIMSRGRSHTTLGAGLCITGSATIGKYIDDFHTFLKKLNYSYKKIWTSISTGKKDIEGRDIRVRGKNLYEISDYIIYRKNKSFKPTEAQRKYFAKLYNSYNSKRDYCSTKSITQSLSRYCKKIKGRKMNTAFYSINYSSSNNHINEIKSLIGKEYYKRNLYITKASNLLLETLLSYEDISSSLFIQKIDNLLYNSNLSYDLSIPFSESHILNESMCSHFLTYVQKDRITLSSLCNYITSINGRKNLQLFLRLYNFCYSNNLFNTNIEVDSSLLSNYINSMIRSYCYNSFDNYKLGIENTIYLYQNILVNNEYNQVDQIDKIKEYHYLRSEKREISFNSSILDEKEREELLNKKTSFEMLSCYNKNLTIKNSFLSRNNEFIVR